MSNHGEKTQAPIVKFLFGKMDRALETAYMSGVASGPEVVAACIIECGGMVKGMMESHTLDKKLPGGTFFHPEDQKSLQDCVDELAKALRGFGFTL